MVLKSGRLNWKRGIHYTKKDWKNYSDRIETWQSSCLWRHWFRWYKPFCNLSVVPEYKRSRGACQFLSLLFCTSCMATNKYPYRRQSFRCKDLEIRWINPNNSYILQLRTHLSAFMDVHCITRSWHAFRISVSAADASFGIVNGGNFISSGLLSHWVAIS